MRKYTINNERITVKTPNFKIYVLAAASALIFIGGIRLICELLVLINKP